MPDGCVDVFVTAQGDVMIAGPANTFYDLPATDKDVLTGLRLRPGAAAAVIGHPASEFRDMRVALDPAFGVAGSRIAENLLGATIPEQRMSLLADLVTDYFAAADPTLDRPVAWAVGVLRAQPDRPVAELAAEVGLSERQLRRRFEVAVGYGPKRLGRIFRFQRLLDFIHASHGSLVAVGDRGRIRRPIAHDQRVRRTDGRASHRTPRSVRFVQYRRKAVVLAFLT
jgi:AraC-like DNA-binding protein